MTKHMKLGTLLREKVYLAHDGWEVQTAWCYCLVKAPWQMVSYGRVPVRELTWWGVKEDWLLVLGELALTGTHPFLQDGARSTRPALIPLWGQYDPGISHQILPFKSATSFQHCYSGGQASSECAFGGQNIQTMALDLLNVGYHWVPVSVNYKNN